VNPGEADALVGHVAGRLAAAVADRQAGWRTPMLATIDETGAPTLRTVVLRAAAPADRTLRFHTDRRSGKVRQIGLSPQVELGFWDPAGGEQLRVGGRARLITEDAELAARWAALTPPGRRLYGDNRAMLAIVAVVWERWDWLWLDAPEGHRRARVDWNNDGTRTAAWIAP
jgi:general stress protein 26